MRQALLSNPYEFQMQDVKNPGRGENEVLIKVAYVGVCGSDLHVYNGHHPKVKAPVVIGHEMTGYVEEAPEGSSLRKGQKIAAVPYVGCGTCEHCKAGKPNLCYQRQVYGFQRPGAHAEYIALPEANVIALPEDYDMKMGTLYEPLAVIVHGLSLIKMKEKQQIFVTGAGTIGLITSLYARDTLKRDVTIVEVNEDRVKLAQSLGFSVVNSTEALCGVWNGGDRPVVVECTGNLGVFESLFDLRPAPADIMILSNFPKEKQIGIHFMCRYETKVYGSQMYVKEEVLEAIEILSRQKNTYKKLIVDKDFPLEDAKDAFEEAIHGTDGVKSVIRVEDNE